jgi:hypothetical protein
LCFFCIQPAGAADWSVTPQFKAGASYDSNINFTLDHKTHDYIFNLSPAVDFKYASEISQLVGRLALNGLLYVRNSNLDALNQAYTVSGQRKVAPRLALRFDGGYIVDSTLAEELTASGFIMNRTKREAINAAPGLAFDLSERALLKMGYAFNQVNYQDDRFIGYLQHTANLGLHYLLKNEKTTISSFLVGRFTNYPSIDNEYRNLISYAGLEHKISQDWSVSLAGGLNYNWFTSQTAVFDFGSLTPFTVQRQVTQRTFNVTPFINIEGKHKWAKTGLIYGYKLDQSASGGGTISQFHSTYGSITHNFTERLRGSLRGNLYYSNASSPGSTYENLTLSFSPEVNYQITEKLSVNSSYQYGWRDDLVSERTANRHLVLVYFNYSYPLHFQK